jgi:hypothetical protein
VPAILSESNGEDAGTIIRKITVVKDSNLFRFYTTKQQQQQHHQNHTNNNNNTNNYHNNLKEQV